MSEFVPTDAFTPNGELAGGVSPVKHRLLVLVRVDLLISLDNKLLKDVCERKRKRK
jgi:hypothetical protein